MYAILMLIFQYRNSLQRHITFVQLGIFGSLFLFNSECDYNAFIYNV